MTALIIILCIVAFFALLFSIPAHVVIEANSDVRVYARVLFIKYALFPMKKRKKKTKTAKKSKKTAKKAVKSPKKQAKKASGEKPKKSMRDIIGLVKLILKLVAAVLRKFPKHFRVRILRYEITVGTKDAAKTAILYGSVTGLSSTLFERLGRVTKFSIKRNAPVNVYADFLGEQTKADIAIDFSITIWGVLHMVMAAGLAFVKAKMTAKPKAPAKAEKPSPSTQDQK